jgi:hypothetical protein
MAYIPTTGGSALARSALVAAACLLGTLGPVAAASIDGDWVTDLGACKKVFVKKGGQSYLARDADLYGSGFVISGTTIRGKLATCKITSLKEEGATVRVRAACATDIMLSDNQFELTMQGADKLVRAFPGVPEMDTPFYRCR